VTAKNWLKGMVAGFIATVALSILMLMKQRMGLMPQLNPVEMLTKWLADRCRLSAGSLTS
jgi:hypothetical protein